jgi:uroporphyrinogen-III synthase
MALVESVAGEAMINAEDSTGSLPLTGRRILITRAPHQASELADRLSALGATPVLIPTIEIGPPTSFAALDAAVAALASFDLVAFTSTNAVRAFQERAAAVGVTPAPRRIAVVGPATAGAVEAMGLRVDVVPPVFTAESLGQTLLPEVRGQRILLVLAEYAPGILESALKGGGAEVTVAAAYKNRIPDASLSAVTELFAEPAAYPDAMTFTSASTAKNLVALLEGTGLTLPGAVVRASIGPITSRALVELGLPPHVEASEPTIPALVEAVAAHLRGC